MTYNSSANPLQLFVSRGGSGKKILGSMDETAVCPINDRPTTNETMTTTNYAACPAEIVEAPVGVVRKLLTDISGWGKFFELKEGPADSLLRLKRAAEQEHRGRKAEKGES